MSALTELLVNTLSVSIETLGESKLVDVLNTFHKNDPVQYEKCLRGGYQFAQALTTLVDKTKTPIDNIFAQAIKEAIETSAAQNGITL